MDIVAPSLPLIFRCSLSLFVAAVLFAGSGFAQQTPEGKGEHVSLDYGRAAHAKGDFASAYEHFLFGLARAENPLEVVELLLENAAAAADADAQALWAHEYFAAGADARGRLLVKKDQANWMLAEDPWPA